MRLVSYLNTCVLTAKKEDTLVIRVGDGQDITYMRSRTNTIEAFESLNAPYPSRTITRSTKEKGPILGEGQRKDASSVPKEMTDSMIVFQIPYLIIIQMGDETSE